MPTLLTDLSLLIRVSNIVQKYKGELAFLATQSVLYLVESRQFQAGLPFISFIVYCVKLQWWHFLNDTPVWPLSQPVLYLFQVSFQVLFEIEYCARIQGWHFLNSPVWPLCKSQFVLSTCLVSNTCFIVYRALCVNTRVVFPKLACQPVLYLVEISFQVPFKSCIVYCVKLQWWYFPSTPVRPLARPGLYSAAGPAWPPWQRLARYGGTVGGSARDHIANTAVWSAGLNFCSRKKAATLVVFVFFSYQVLASSSSESEGNMCVCVCARVCVCIF